MTVAERIAGRRVVASISGGKDSAAMSLHLKELGIEHDRVFMDTGWEHPKTYEYIRGELARVIGPIKRIRGKKPMAKLIAQKAMFPSRTIRFCTEELKVFPMQAYLNKLVAAGADVVNAVGIRQAESKARSEMAEWEWSEGFDCEVWRPLIAWTEDEVIAIHKRHGLAPNPLYLMGAKRVGCWPCIMASKQEIRLIADVDPGRIDAIRKIEGQIGEKAQRRYCARLKVFQERGADALPARDRKALLDEDGKVKPFTAPAWFQAMGALRTDDSGQCVPIDEVVKWSRTSRGGRQYEMFAASPSDAGCMRWGLCETPTPDPQSKEPGR